jgi:putative N-acetyltransferase (TIGR04045 family)
MSAPAMTDLIARLGGPGPRPAERPEFLVVRADGNADRIDAFAQLRRREFVQRQGLFAADDSDEHDGAPHTRVLVAATPAGEVLGGVRLHPEGDPAFGWWRGSRLVCRRSSGAARGHVGAALVAAACAEAVAAGALRFEAHVQGARADFFARLGWRAVRSIRVAGVAHVLMRWPVDRFEELAGASKGPLGRLLAGLLAAPDGFGADDGVPVPGSSVVAATDAILPAMVDRDPEWAGWCGMLVTAHDLSAMGAVPVGALDTIAARDTAHAQRIVDGLRAGSRAFGLPVLGGHTQLGVPGALSVTGLGRAADPVPAAGGAPGDALTLTADLEGGWRPGYRGSQWDSTSFRAHSDLAAMLSAVGRARPCAAKDVSMAGVVGTAGMLAEASGCGAELDVASIPRPAAASLAEWLTCFPGFAMLTADRPGAPPLQAGPATGAVCGELVRRPGVRLRWPDGEVTEAIAGPVTGIPSREDVGR